MFFERPESGELAVLVHLDFTSPTATDVGFSDPREFEELVLSAGGDPAEFVTGNCAVPNARYFVGKGKLDEIRHAVLAVDAKLAIFNHPLSPSQERNLEKELQCRVLDRTGLILDIFAQRARTHEGKLQVELAQLRHMTTRLVRGWTHLERQKGGIGLRGPGETQLETDRRLLRTRIKSIEKRLEKVRKQRQQGRRSRQRNQLPVIALVGYTNAGKSTLFNQLTQAAVFAEDQLFATLDPTMRRIQLPDVGVAVLADTVGFISDLPHHLVQAFRATLEEVAEADVLLHVIDAADPSRDLHSQQVEEVLQEIEAHQVPRVEVMNKIDCLEESQSRENRDREGQTRRVWLSGLTGEGCDHLLQVLGSMLSGEMIEGVLKLTSDQFRLRALLHQQDAVTGEKTTETGGMALEIRLPAQRLQSLLKQDGLSADDIDLEIKGAEGERALLEFAPASATGVKPQFDASAMNTRLEK